MTILGKIFHDILKRECVLHTIETLDKFNSLKCKQCLFR